MGLSTGRKRETPFSASFEVREGAFLVCGPSLLLLLHVGLQVLPSHVQLVSVEGGVPLPAVATIGPGDSSVPEESPGLHASHVELSSQILQSDQVLSLGGLGGGLLGLGLGNSIQKHFYLPEPQTDFIFSIISEELGFLGIIIVSALFCFID